MSQYINQEEVFIKGTYKEDAIADVADEDPEYLQRLLEEGVIDAEDRKIIQATLGIDNPEGEE